MNRIDKNIEAVTKAAQTIEKKLCETEMQPMTIVESCKKMTDYINAANLLYQIKAAQQPIIVPPKKTGLFKL